MFCEPNASFLVNLGIRWTTCTFIAITLVYALIPWYTRKPRFNYLFLGFRAITQEYGHKPRYKADQMHQIYHNCLNRGLRNINSLHFTLTTRRRITQDGNDVSKYALPRSEGQKGPIVKKIGRGGKYQESFCQHRIARNSGYRIPTQNFNP